MAKTYNKMLMDVNGKIGNIVTEVQGDQNSRYLDINLFNNGIPINLTGHTVRIYMRRPHTNPLEEFFNDGEITEAARGRCQFLLSTQALAKEGELEAQVSIWKGTEEILSTQVFKINVTKKLRTSGSVESSNEYGALVVLFQNLYEAHDLMTTMVQSFGESGETAASVPATTFWQMLEAVYRVNADALANASVQGVLDLIGATADTGGSGAAGTVMAKLNHLIGKTSDEIAGVTAQTKKFTQTVRGYVSKQETTTINGSGRILVWTKGEVSKMKVSVDGGMDLSIDLTDHVYEIYFDKSIKLSNMISSSDYFYYLHYIVQT